MWRRTATATERHDPSTATALMCISVMRVVAAMQLMLYNHTGVKYDRPWYSLLSEFAVGTTVHGIKYFAEPSKWICRKWVHYRQAWQVCNRMNIYYFTTREV